LFEDECEFHLNPGLSRMWWPIGKSCEVPSAGQNRRVAVFGALDAVGGRLTSLLTDRKRSVEYLQFLRLVLCRHKDRHIYLFLDNCSIHSSKVVMRFFADHKDRITPIWNAPYTPELNRIERYWGHLKSKAIHNYFFGTLNNLKAAIREAIARFNRSKSLNMKCLIEVAHSLHKAA
jgi:transposase